MVKLALIGLLFLASGPPNPSSFPAERRVAINDDGPDPNIHDACS
jgi:hypothetical protein